VSRAAVRFQFPRDSDRTVAYQKYYLLGFEEHARLRFDGAPLLVRLAPGVTNRMRIAFRRQHGRGQGHVGRYLANGLRFAIDAHDGREVRDHQTLEWADVYFKSNRWAGEAYEAKVLPLVNGNGLLDRSRIDRLRRLRSVEKTVDVAYLSNVWGGREHSLRVFERLAELDCSKDLLAIFPEGFPVEEDAANMERLRRCGVPVTRQPLPPAELWSRLARARLVPLRAGKHLCFSWRTIDLLAIGACIVFDSLPPPRWPVPLEPGIHVADCGIARPDDTEAATPAEYEKLAPVIEALLADEPRVEELRREAARYFDEHARPAAVARHVIAELASVRRKRGLGKS
jgi:hypothetical protein